MPSVSGVSGVWRNGPETPIWGTQSCLSIVDPYILESAFSQLESSRKMQRSRKLLMEVEFLEQHSCSIVYM